MRYVVSTLDKYLSKSDKLLEPITNIEYLILSICNPILKWRIQHWLATI